MIGEKVLSSLELIMRVRDEVRVVTHSSRNFKSIQRIKIIRLPVIDKRYCADADPENFHGK